MLDISNNLNSSLGKKDLSMSNFQNNNTISLNNNISNLSSNTVFNSNNTNNAEVEYFDFSDITNELKKDAATAGVIATSITSGVLKVGENILNGIAYVSTNAISLTAKLLGQTEFSEKLDAKLNEYLAKDKISNIQNNIYTNTNLGKNINEYSYIKFDSDIASKISEVSSTITSAIAACGATFLVGGFASPIIGALSGIGSSASSNAQNDAHGIIATAMILVSGVLNGISWQASGNLYSTFYKEITNSIGQVGIKQTGAIFAKSVANKDFVVKWLKSSFTDIGNYISAGLMSANELIPFITGEKEVTVDNCLDVLGKVALNFGFNVLEDGFRGSLQNYNATQIELRKIARQNKIDEYKALKEKMSTDGYISFLDDFLNDRTTTVTDESYEYMGLYSKLMELKKEISGFDDIPDDIDLNFDPEVFVNQRAIMRQKKIDDYNNALEFSNLLSKHSSISGFLNSLKANGLSNEEIKDLIPDYEKYSELLNNINANDVPEYNNMLKKLSEGSDEHVLGAGLQEYISKQIRKLMADINPDSKADLQKLLDNLETEKILEFTPDELYSTQYYTGYGYNSINCALRGIGDYNSDFTQKRIADIMSVIEKSNGLDSDRILYRGLRKANIFEGLLQDVDFRDPEAIYAALKGTEGIKLTDKGFMSTAKSMNGVMNGNITMEIIAPKGTKGIDVQNFSTCLGEEEFILSPNTQLLITDVSMGLGHDGNKSVIVKCLVDQVGVATSKANYEGTILDKYITQYKTLLDFADNNMKFTLMDDYEYSSHDLEEIFNSFDSKTQEAFDNLDVGISTSSANFNESFDNFVLLFRNFQRSEYQTGKAIDALRERVEMLINFKEKISK